MSFKMSGLIFLLVFACLSQSQTKMDKYYFSGFLMEDPEEIFAFPEYRVPQTITFYKIEEKFGEPQKVQAKVIDYKFDSQGLFLGTDQQPANHDFQKECTYKDGRLVELIYDSGNIEKIIYDSVFNRISDRLYSSTGTLRRRINYTGDEDTLIATTINGLSGMTVSLTMIQIITHGNIDTLKITKVDKNKGSPVTTVSFTVYKNGVLQGAIIKASGAVVINGYAQGADTAQITDVFAFDSTGKRTKRVYATQRGNDVSESSQTNVVTHVYTNDSTGRPLEIKHYNLTRVGLKVEDVLTKSIEFKYAK